MDKPRPNEVAWAASGVFGFFIDKIPFLFNFCNFPPFGLERRAVSSWVGSGYRRPISVPPVRLPYYVSRVSIAHTFCDPKTPAKIA